MDKNPAQASSLYTCSMAVGLTHNGPLVRSNKWTNHGWVQPMVLVSLVQRQPRPTPYIPAGWQLALFKMTPHEVRRQMGQSWLGTSHSACPKTITTLKKKREKQNEKVTNSNSFLLRWVMETGLYS
jgi:hypothetical protein